MSWAPGRVVRPRAYSCLDCPHRISSRGHDGATGRVDLTSAGGSGQQCRGKRPGRKPARHSQGVGEMGGCRRPVREDVPATGSGLSRASLHDFDIFAR